MPPLLTLLRQRVLLLDGAMGTLLIDRGLGRGASPEGWNLERPELVRSVHQAYYEAGSDVVQTNTFGGNRHRLEHYGLGGRVREVNRRAAALAREVCPAGRFVAGNIGPSGRFLPPVGDFTPARLEEAFAEQAEALAEGGVDLISIETMSDVREAVCALRAARRVSGLPVFACLTFSRIPRGFFTTWGNGVESGVKALEEEGAEVIGANCTLDAPDMAELAPRLRAASGRPVLVKPNAGQPRLEDGRVTYAGRGAGFVADVERMLDAGVAVVGGCCGTTPETIREVAALLRRRRGASA